MQVFAHFILIVCFIKRVFHRKLNKGNIVNWDRAQWNFTNAELGRRTQEEVCKLPDPRDVAFPERRTYEKHNLLCKAINGKVTVITSEDFQARFTDMFLSTIPKSILSSSLTFLQVWAGWDDVTKEGDWWNINTGESMSNSLLLWSPGMEFNRHYLCPRICPSCPKSCLNMKCLCTEVVSEFVVDFLP